MASAAPLPGPAAGPPGSGGSRPPRISRPQVPQARKVEVDRPGAQLAPAGVAQVRLPAPGQDRPPRKMAEERISRMSTSEISQRRRAVVFTARASASQWASQPRCRRMRMEASTSRSRGQPQQRHLPPCQQRGRQNGQDAVLGPLDRDLSSRRRPPRTDKSWLISVPSESRMVQQSILWPAGVSWLLADFQHGLINSLCGVPDSQGGHGPLHGGPARSVMKDAAGRLEQRLTGAVLLQQHRGTAGVFQDPRVFFLVVVGDIGGTARSAPGPPVPSAR